MNYAVIMAGGSGKRLWPLSRQKRPKQVLKLLGGETLLRKCYHRLTGIFEDQNIIVLTNANFVETVRDDLPELPKGNIIAEPAMRDTASAIGLAAAILHKRDADSKMAVVTADQLLQPVESFQQAMQSALNS
ncbi:MAG: sugar phosphate nucleotidyltransferase, partial [Planctomycetota bacterium]